MTYGYKTLKEFKNEYIMEAEQSIIVPEYSANKDLILLVEKLMFAYKGIYPKKKTQRMKLKNSVIG